MELTIVNLCIVLLVFFVIEKGCLKYVFVEHYTAIYVFIWFFCHPSLNNKNFDLRKYSTTSNTALQSCWLKCFGHFMLVEYHAILNHDFKVLNKFCSFRRILD